MKNGSKINTTLCGHNNINRLPFFVLWQLANVGAHVAQQIVIGYAVFWYVRPSRLVSLVIGSHLLFVKLLSLLSLLIR
jgi:hypothetical protein